MNETVLGKQTLDANTSFFCKFVLFPFLKSSVKLRNVAFSSKVILNTEQHPSSDPLRRRFLSDQTEFQPSSPHLRCFQQKLMF